MKLQTPCRSCIAEGRARASHACTLIFAAVVVLAFGCGKDPEKVTGEGKKASEVEALKSAQHVIHMNAAEPLACKDCHERISGSLQPPKSRKCSECHEQQRLILHGSASNESNAKTCWSCHDFKGESKSPTACLTCHAQAQGGLPGIAAHDPKKPDEDCSECHRAHEEPSLVAACETCHEGVKVSGHDKPEIPITGCVSCHGYHEEASTATVCLGCHRKAKARVPATATFEGGHDTCAHCHKPHRFFKAEVAPCAECHKDVHALSQEKVKEHRSCIGCHDNHDVRGSLAQSCRGCHKKLSLGHPAKRKTVNACVGCHEPHRGPSSSPAVACTSCHDQARSDNKLHQGRRHKGPVCRDCHKPHDFNRIKAEASLCLRCHGPKPFKNAKTVRAADAHSNCVRCHGKAVAHQPTRPPVVCQSCHKEKVGQVRKEHRDCKKCHDPHSTIAKPCGSCHKTQATVMRTGHKRQCITCHEPHSGRVSEPCSRCHKTQAKTVSPGNAKCVECHDPHAATTKGGAAKVHE